MPLLPCNIRSSLPFNRFRIQFLATCGGAVHLKLIQSPLLIMAQPPKPQHAYPANHQPGHLLRRALTLLLCVLLALQSMLAQAPATAQAI